MTSLNKNILSEWTSEIEAALKSSLSQYCAIFNLKGNLLFSNEAFNDLVKDNHRDSFKNPTFNSLISIEQHESLIFQGYLTIGDSGKNDISLFAHVFRKNEKILFLGGLDSPQILRQNSQLAELNSEINKLQRELVKKTVSLEHALDQLGIANQELKKEQMTRDKLYSVIAHDLRSPLNTIIGFITLMKDTFQEISVEEIENYLDIINSSTNKTLGLLDNLLNWTKTQTGQIIFNPQKVDLTEIINEIIDIALPTAKVKNINFRFKPVHEADVLVDPEMFKVILRNIFYNAIKFTHLNGEIEVISQIVEDNIQISIRDSGVGMDKTTCDKLFSSDETFTTTGTGGEKGSGLGLLVSKEFVNRHNGKIWAESGEGVGTTFFIRLKEFSPKSKQLVNTSQSDNLKSNSSPTILIAEDDEIGFNYLKSVLESDGYTILRAKNGTEVITICKTNPEIDLVLMDILMPKVDGYEATREILKFRPELPIIGQSSLNFAENREKAIKTGCIDFFVKPVSKNDLLSIVEKHLK
ncbi:MAG: hypothetical protein SCALA702_36310 [Melioribacteraceae bacterium]|nr:MAG: hypothetical protein SCALA702_36310 [Melioribacteraceae bacterium]